MCSNYRPVTRLDRLLTFFGVEREKNTPVAEETWPLGFSPFIRLHEDGSGNKVIDDGMFGLLPHFAKELAYGRKTYNARTETVDKLPSFRESWAKGWRCIIPVESVYEQSYETGTAVRWRVQRPNGIPMALAGVYRPWRGPDGKYLWTFAMLTVNADGHTVYARFHKPEDEKRMIVILGEEDYDRWLTCSVEEAKSFFKQWMEPLETFAAPVLRGSPKRGDRN